MKRTALATLAAFAALPLLAAEQPLTTAPPPVDSPLVRAAKAATQASGAIRTKKKIVITNDNLVRIGGHITTTTAQQPLPPPSRVDPNLDRLAAQQQQQYAAEQAAQAKTKREAQERQRLAAEHANAIYEGDDAAGIYEDPATTEGRAGQVSPVPPQQLPTMKVQKPPM